MTDGALSEHSARRRAFAFWAGLAIIVLLALLPRSIYPVSRPMQWYGRSVRFWDALLTGDLSGTYQQYHPGVTTMWIAGLGLRIHAVTQGWSANELAVPPLTPDGIRDYPIEAGVTALSFVIAACVGLTYVLLTRMQSWSVAFIAGCLLALDPFYIGLSKVLHVDALLASFMLISVLFLICHLQQKSRSCLIFSGVFAGLAFLSKSPSVLLLPFTVLATLMSSFAALRNNRNHTARDSFRGKLWGPRLRTVTCTLGIWGITAGLVFILLWPAMWSSPVRVVSDVVDGVLFGVETAHDSNFFAGQVSNDDPGWLFYVATLAWHTTLITLSASGVAMLFLLWRRRRGEDNRLEWWLLIYAASFFVLMALSEKKGARYLLPAFLALDVVAAWGLVQAVNAMGRWDRLRRFPWAPTLVVATALLVQGVSVLRHHPYYGAHHNLLLGGSRVAQHILPLGDQGEGIDLAARYLNSYPAADLRFANVQQRFIEMFERNFAGHTQGVDQPNADYWVFAVNPVQREMNINDWKETWDVCQETEPLWSVSFDGIPYVWICRPYPHTPEAFTIERQLDVELGDHIRLLGYQLSSSRLSEHDALTATLFWQSDGRLTGDYHVFVHLLDSDGQLAAQHDSVPVEGRRPTWNWRDTEIIQDEHVLITNLSPGTYELSVGMYDLITGERLPAISPSGERLPEDRIILEEIRVTTP
jgi:hypothetical protein